MEALSQDGQADRPRGRGAEPRADRPELRFSGSRTQLDSTLRQLLWLSGWLTDREVVHQIDWLDPDTLEPQTKQIRAPQDLQELLRALLQTHLTGDTPTIAQRLYPNADWRYHIQPAAQEVSV